MEILEAMKPLLMTVGVILMVSQLDNFFGHEKGPFPMTATKESRRAAIKPFLFGLLLFIGSMYLFFN